MSLLTFLPRLTAWGSNQKGRSLEPLVAEDLNRDLKQDILAYERNVNIDITRSQKKRKPRRKKISYWSEDETVSLNQPRYSLQVVSPEIVDTFVGIQQGLLTSQIPKIRDSPPLGGHKQLLATRMTSHSGSMAEQRR